MLSRLMNCREDGDLFPVAIVIPHDEVRIADEPYLLVGVINAL
jgi:hypothetical protein